MIRNQLIRQNKNDRVKKIVSDDVRIVNKSHNVILFDDDGLVEQKFQSFDEGRVRVMNYRIKRNVHSVRKHQFGYKKLYDNVRSERSESLSLSYKLDTSLTHKPLLLNKAERNSHLQVKKSKKREEQFDQIKKKSHDRRLSHLSNEEADSTHIENVLDNSKLNILERSAPESIATLSTKMNMKGLVVSRENILKNIDRWMFILSRRFADIHFINKFSMVLECMYHVCTNLDLYEYHPSVTSHFPEHRESSGPVHKNTQNTQGKRMVLHILSMFMHTLETFVGNRSLDYGKTVSMLIDIVIVCNKKYGDTSLQLFLCLMHVIEKIKEFDYLIEDDIYCSIAGLFVSNAVLVLENNIKYFAGTSNLYFNIPYDTYGLLMVSTTLDTILSVSTRLTYIIKNDHFRILMKSLVSTLSRYIENHSYFIHNDISTTLHTADVYSALLLFTKSSLLLSYYSTLSSHLPHLTVHEDPSRIELYYQSVLLLYLDYLSKTNIRHYNSILPTLIHPLSYYWKHVEYIESDTSLEQTTTVRLNDTLYTKLILLVQKYLAAYIEDFKHSYNCLLVVSRCLRLMLSFIDHMKIAGSRHEAYPHLGHHMKRFILQVRSSLLYIHRSKECGDLIQLMGSLALLASY